jgi:hypothetical protein
VTFVPPVRLTMTLILLVMFVWMLVTVRRRILRRRAGPILQEKEG